jgi:hypothetical protein
MDILLCRFLVRVEGPYQIKHSAGSRFWLFTNCRQQTMNIWMFNVTFLEEPHGPSLSMLITFHFASLFHALRPLALILKQQFFSQACKTRAIWWWNNVLPVYYHTITWATLQIVFWMKEKPTWCTVVYIYCSCWRCSTCFGRVRPSSWALEN